jgi:dTDP-4-amino-4,6-dideoxygalactose transaminase
MIPVTKCYLPPIDEYYSILKEIWEKEWITNRGEFVQDLEKKLMKFLGLKESNLICMNNGTIPLQIALKILGEKGEVITTPFSYVASTSVILWENCTPVFVDIHPEYLTIDETKIEAAITDRTSCILATHVFGNPCNIDEIDRIALKYNLKVIYDAAHCFGVNYNGKSIFEYGDVSTCSFHATKIFNTAEGGAFFCKNKDIYNSAFLKHSFGHSSDQHIELGINGKMSEMLAALGIINLNYIDTILLKRKDIISYYHKHLNFGKLRTIKIREYTDWNYSYFPIIFEKEEMMLNVKSILEDEEIFCRRYFYPSLDNLPYLDSISKVDISNDISSRILCIPLYNSLSINDLSLICEIINQNL